ncbi:uncharacterized protein LOC141654834 [Silene latifolia]|uniref:uncharacterized protein LOC141654834 n=1 Tax=Silene latifolia TaxID=37657 RepID=UPI003D786AD1
MLPCAGEDVPVGTDDKELVQSWRKRFGALPNKDISLDKVRDEMLKLVGGGPDFKRLFVLFSMGSFLAPTVHNRVDTRLIGAVEDVAGIPKMDWCSFIMDRLDYSVGSWKGNNSKSIGGCLMFFQLLYFHRLTWRGLPAPSTIPLIQHWTYDDLKRRVKEECKAYTVHRGFGIGVWDLKTYPVSLYLEKSFYRQTVETVVPEVEATMQDEARPAENSAAARVQGCRTVSLPLPDDLPTDEDLRRLYIDERVLKWYQSKRNQQLVSRLHREMVADWTSDPPCLGGRRHVDQALKNVVPPPSFDLGIDDIGKEAPSRSYGLRYTRARDRPVPKPAGPVQSSTSDVTRATSRPVTKPVGNKRK